MILLAHTPCENLYLEDMEYVVFNDLVNRIKCTGELLRKYVPGLINEKVISEKEIEDVFIPKMREKTGGIPLAVYRLGTAIFEGDFLKYEGNLERFFSSPLYLNPDLKSVYEEMWEDLVEAMWNQIDSNAKSLIICASYFGGDISIDMLKFLLKDTMAPEVWKNTLSQAYQYMFVMESGRNQEEGEDGNFRGVRLFPIIKDLIRFKYWNESEFNKYMQFGVDFYLEQIKNLNADAVYSGEKTFLDRGGELTIVREVLRFCARNNFNEQYLALTGNNLADFFYMRTKNLDIADLINEERSKVARKLSNHIQVMETYGMYMRRAARWNKKESALEVLERAEDYWKKHPEINIYECNRFLNGKAVVLFKIKRDIKGARKIWRNMLRECKLNDRERSWCRRWELKSDFVLKSESLGEMTEKFQSGFRYASSRGFYRAAVDYLLYTVRCYFLMHMQDSTGGEYIYHMEFFLKEAEKFLERYSFLDDQYRADYYYFYCCLLALKGEKIEEALQKASKMASKVNEMSKYRMLKNLLRNLEKNGDGNCELGEFYDRIIYFC